MDSIDKRIKNEELFISLLLEHKDLVGDWFNSPLQINYFHKAHKLLLYAVEESYNKKSLLTKKQFRYFAKPRVSNDVELNAYMATFDRISMLDEERDNFSVLLKTILDNHISERTVEYIDEYRKNLASKGATIALQELAKKAYELASDSCEERQKTTYEPISVIAPEFLENMKAEIAGDAPERIICGISEIDNSMVTGFAPGTLTLFCGDIGSFKSTLMLNVGIGVWEKGHSVLFIPLEMPTKQMFIKYLARQLLIDSTRLQTPKILTDKEIEKIEKYTKKLSEPMENRFYIMETYERIPVSLIRREVEKHIDLFKPRLVIVDYIANLIPENTEYYGRNRNEASQIGDMLKALRAMGRPKAVHEEGFAVVSGAQIGREALKRIRKQSMDKVLFNSEDIRGSHEYSADADYMYAQLIDEAQPNSRLIFQAIKTRYAAKTIDGKIKGSLKMRPEFSLIGSEADKWNDTNVDNVMNKVDSINIDDELDFNDAMQNELDKMQEDELSIGDMDICVDDIDLEEDEKI